MFSIWNCLSEVDFIFSAACSQNQHTKLFQPSYFRISGPTQGWKRQSFQKQILPFHIMLARHVICFYITLNRTCKVNFFTKNSFFLQVTYQTDTFLDKNRDYVVVEHCNLMSSSKCHFVAGLFPLPPEESSRSSYKFSSVASRFKVENFYLSSIIIVVLCSLVSCLQSRE